MSASKIAVVIPTAGRDDLLLACLRSLRPNPETWTGLVVVQDGDAPPSAEVEAEIEKLDVPKHPGLASDRLGAPLAALWNWGIEEAFREKVVNAWSTEGLGADYALVLNDDVEMPFGWDTQLVPWLDAHPDKMCVCLPDRLTMSTLLPCYSPENAEELRGVPQAERWGHRKWTVAPGVSADPNRGEYPQPGGFEAFAASFRILQDFQAWAPCSMNGAAFVLRRSAWEDGLRFDAGHELCFEDTDFWLRLLEAYGPQRIGSFMRVFVHHWRASTIGAIPGAQERIDRSKLHFQKKWAGKEALVEWFSAVNATPLGVPWPEPPANAPWLPLERAKRSWDGWTDRDVATEVKP